MVMALAAVAAGGAGGTLLRDVALSIQHTPALRSPHVAWPSQVPWVLLTINFVGVVLATSLLRGPLRQHDPNDLTRLLLITGFLGGFTSYSSLFTSLALIWHLSVVASLAVGFFAVGSGVVAAWLGLQVPRR